MTYLQLMQSRDGIYAKNNGENHRPVAIPSAEEVLSKLALTQHLVAENLFAEFAEGRDGFRAVAAGLQGRSLAPLDMQGKLVPLLSGRLAGNGNPEKAWPYCASVLLLCSGSGTFIRIDRDNCFYNTGYIFTLNNTNTGRSYVSAGGGPLLDTSYEEYLQGISDYFRTSTTAAGDFCRAVLRFVVDCDASGFEKLDRQGQRSAADFIAIYTAELTRNTAAFMKATSAWQVDVAEVTFLWAYGSRGLAIHNGALVPVQDGKLVAIEGGKPVELDARLYLVNNGLGSSEGDFRKLGGAIARYAQAGPHNGLLKALLDLTPISDPNLQAQVGDDVFYRSFVFLNRPEFQLHINEYAKEIENALLEFLIQTSAEAPLIAAQIQKTGCSQAGTSR